MTVYVLRISHRHGDDTSVYASEQLALDSLEEYVREWWSEAFDAAPPASGEIEQEELIERYFQETQETFGREEYYSLESLQIQGILDRAS